MPQRNAPLSVEGGRRPVERPRRTQKCSASRIAFLAGPVCCRRGPGIHRSTAMRAFIDVHGDWLTVFSLPAHAPAKNARDR
ncbi:hypothetical protein ACFVH6_07850 [Spirillospora sp. NPDC127200]